MLVNNKTNTRLNVANWLAPRDEDGGDEAWEHP
jgi:hypothetical protein